MAGKEIPMVMQVALVAALEIGLHQATKLAALVLLDKVILVAAHQPQYILAVAAGVVLAQLVLQ
jgi:hypothetical protein